MHLLRSDLLHIEARHGPGHVRESIRSIELLVSIGANISSKDMVGRTPLSYADKDPLKADNESLFISISKTIVKGRKGILSRINDRQQESMTAGINDSKN